METENKTKIINTCYYSLIVSIYILLLYLAGRNLTLDFLWYDDSGQFFISRGLNHNSPAYADRGGITDVINSNAYFNKDPGGYGMLLYFWSALSTNLIWLRLLSFIFMIGAISFSIAAAQQIFKNFKISILSGFFCFTLLGSGTVNDHFYGLRAYSMELCGIIAGVWLILWLYNNVTPRKLIISSLLLCIFITSRYTMMVFGAIFSLIVIWEIFNTNLTLKNKIIYSVIYALPLLLTVSAIYIFATRIQNSSIEPLFYIKYLPHTKVFLIFLIVSFLITLPLKYLNNKCRLLITFYWIINIVFIILGYFSILPWNLFFKYGGPFAWLIEFTTFCVVSSLLIYNFNIRQVLLLINALTFAFIGYVWHISRGTGLQEREKIIGKNILSALKNYPQDTIYVNRYGCPEIRFYFEYGMLKPYAKELGYPERFKYLYGIPHNSSREKWHDIDFQKRKSDFYKNMPVNSILLGIFMVEDSIYKDKFMEIKPYINLRIKE